MGNMCASVSKTKDYITSADDETVYALKKRHAGCTGMFWRRDPTGKGIALENNNHWPRDGAMLKGQVVTGTDGAQWLAATHVQQGGNGEWLETPYGSFLPFEYDNHYYLEKV